MRGMSGAVAAIVATLSVAPSQAADTIGTLVTSSGSHKLSIEVADDPRSRQLGLMNRDHMAPEHGMLFDFDETQPVIMWMKNTRIPLDMLFMNEAGTVTSVKERAQPQSLDLISSGGPVRYVLELNGGTAALLGVRTGDRLRHPIIPAKPE